ncbi:MAG TPA: DUF3352 domain-containing protein [Candidatus Limnocylindrales bacterium]|nr:DUF3352 domain-containing protein [Candidatus Limnocylindrales bacterium]
MDPRPDDPTTIQPVDPISGPTTAPAPEVTNGAVAEPARTHPVAAAPVAGGSRTRWLVGGGVAVAAVAAIALVASFLAASPMPEVLKYLPADSAVVVELRPELPGDQRQHLGNLLAHFPGFEDQSTLDAKLDEVLERVTREASAGQVDYATRVKPLLAGPMVLSVTAGAMTDMMSGSTAEGVLFVATTDGSATCASIFGSTDRGDSHRGVDIESIAGDVGCAIHERYLLVGSLDSIGAGLDARLDGKGVAGSSTYRAARSKLEGDQLGSVFLDGDPIVALIEETAGGLGGAAQLPEGFWVIQGFRVTDEALVFDAYTAAVPSMLPSGAPTSAPAAESRFASALPADTLAFVEYHGVGASVEQALAALGARPGAEEVLQGLEDALLAVGGTDNLTGWIEDAGVAVMPAGDAFGGAVLVRGTDAETATARVAQIRNLLVLASTGTDITVTDSEHDGVTITTVDLGDLSSLLGESGLSVGGEPTRLELAFAARDDLVVISVGDGVVERILDVEAGSSLATAATYGRIIEIAGARNDVQVFIALDATLSLVSGFLPPDELATWSSELKPYLDHLSGVAMTSVNSSSGAHIRGVLTVK